MELLTLLKGLRIVKNNMLAPIYINVDSKEDISMLTNGNLLYDAMLGEYRSFIIGLGHPLVEHRYKIGC